MPDFKFPWEAEQQPNDRVERDLRVRESGSGRSDVPVWSYAPAAGDEIVAMDGDRGKVLSVEAFTVTVHWTSANFSVVYPSELPAGIRKVLPWEY